jgi:hypothetical protein
MCDAANRLGPLPPAEEAALGAAAAELDVIFAEAR